MAKTFQQLAESCTPDDIVKMLRALDAISSEKHISKQSMRSIAKNALPKS